MFFHNKNKIDLKKDSLSEAVGKKIDNKNISDKTLAKIYYTAFNLLKFNYTLALNMNRFDSIKVEICQHLQIMIMTEFPTALNYRVRGGQQTVQARIIRRRQQTVQAQVQVQASIKSSIKNYVIMKVNADNILRHLIYLLNTLNQLNSSITKLNHRRYNEPNQKFDRLVEYLTNIKTYTTGKIDSCINKYIYDILKEIVTNPQAAHSRQVFKEKIPRMQAVLKTALRNKLTDLAGVAFDSGDISTEVNNNKTPAFKNDFQHYRNLINSRLPRHLQQETEKEAKRKAALNHITNEMEILDESKDRSNDDSIKPGGKLIVCKVNEEFLTEIECNEKNITFHDKIKYNLKYVNNGIYKTECDKLQKRFAAI
ncbi:hypothetical protein [Yersinia enterocolitica]|uniref:hypothetical protein n=1 Tax=Yersinia enterocolitica TaxID=630 RepID=UPI00097699CD|nr:hypothetical protein [Yersinia enterocolitica]